MAHVLEPASSGRSKCRGCGRAIARGELRFGERLPNPFGEGEMTLWFHPSCAAWKRPESFLQGLGDAAGAMVPGRDDLERVARFAAQHPRLARIDGAELSRSGQAKCRQCHEPIGKGTWRIRLSFYEDGRFAPGGFIHPGCGPAYFGTGDILAPLLHFSPDLVEADRAELSRLCGPPRWRR